MTEAALLVALRRAAGDPRLSIATRTNARRCVLNHEALDRYRQGVRQSLGAFWTIGLNLRKLILPAVTLLEDRVQRLQGTAATPYLDAILSIDWFPSRIGALVQGITFGGREGYRYEWVSINFGDRSLWLGMGCHDYDSSVGGDTCSETLFEFRADGSSIGDPLRWLEYLAAISRIDSDIFIEQ